MSTIGSIAEPEKYSSLSLSISASVLDLNDMLKKQAIDKDRTEIKINENGPHSDKVTDPQTCVEKIRAIEEPEKAPIDPPALMIPKYIFA